MSKIDTSCLFEDLRYTVDVSYDTDYSCETDCVDDICRCSRILNAKVTDIPCAALAEKIAPESLLLKYCVERILRHFKPIHDSSNWDVEVEGGYYGEEIGEVKLDKNVAESLQNLLLSLDEASDSQIVETALNVEYGFLLPTLTKKNWTLERVACADLILGNKHHAANLDDEHVTRCRINEKPIAGLAVFVDGKYRVIDGYHRITAAKKDNKQVVWVVVGR